MNNTVVEIPHPNRDSNYFDRIMSSGKYDPVKNDMVVNNKVDSHRLNYWTQNVLSPASSVAISRDGLTKLSQYKKKQLREQK